MVFFLPILVYCRIAPLGDRLRSAVGLYILGQFFFPPPVAASIDSSSFELSHASSPFYLWHSRLGHVSSSRLQFMIKKGLLDSNVSFHDISYCNGGHLAKHSTLPFKSSTSSSLAPFELVHPMFGVQLPYLLMGCTILCYFCWWLQSILLVVSHVQKIWFFFINLYFF